MEKDNLQEEKVVDDGRRLHNVLNFQDFVLEEGKKDKNKTKKSRPIKNRKEFIEDNGEDTIDPNNAPERYVKLREQFIKEDYQQRVLAGKQAPSYYPFFQIDHPSKEGGLFLLNNVACVNKMLTLI